MNIQKKQKDQIYTLDNLPLFISLWYREDNIYKYAHIKTRDINGVQDAQIGDFSENWYIRPRKAQHKKPYKTLKDYKIACSLCFKRYKPNSEIDCFSIDTENDYNKIQQVI